MKQVINLLDQLTAEDSVKLEIFEFDGTADSVSAWEKFKNVRFKREKGRVDLLLRGGTVNAYATDISDGNIVTLHAFKASFSGATKEYVLRHTASKLLIDNITDTTTTTFTTLGFDSSVKIQIVQHGRFLYLFDTNGGSASYIDLKDMSAYKWLDADAPPIYGLTWITTGDFKEANVWGFKEGASCAVYMNSFTWQALTLSTLVSDAFIGPGVFKYDYQAGKYIIIDGVNYIEDKVFIFDERVSFSTGGTGTDPVIYSKTGTANPPVVQGEVSFSPTLTKIYKISHVVGSQTLQVTSPWKNIENGGLLTAAADGSSLFTAVPTAPDVSDLLDTNGKYIVSETELVLDANYEEPVFSRAYCIVYELNDGSFTHPGLSSIIKSTTDEIYNGIYLNRRGIQVQLHAGTANAPANAVRGHLFSTRWQLSDRACYGVDEDYPVSKYFHNTSFSVDAQYIEDFKSDSELITGISFYIKHVAGKPSTLPANSIKPHHVSQVKGSLLIGGYTLARPTPIAASTFDAAANCFLEIGISPSTDRVLHIEYEYSDESRSSSTSTFNLGGTITCSIVGWNYFYNRTPPPLVKAIHLYLENPTAGLYYHLGSITDSDPEFFGAPYRFNADVTGLDVVTLTGSVSNELLILENALAWASPMQMIDIGSQKVIEHVQQIERIFADHIDSQRGDTLRYLIYVLTNDRPVLVYFSAQVAGDGLIFNADSEPVYSSTPLTGTFACTNWGGRILYQSSDGLYLWDVRKVSKLIDAGNFSVLSTTIYDAEYHAREHELWLMGTNNEVLVLNDESELIVMQHAYDPDASDCKTLTSLGNELYGAWDYWVNRLDVDGQAKDNNLKIGTALDVDGVIESKPIGRLFDQLYLNRIEVAGEYGTVDIGVDCGLSRYESEPTSWQSDLIKEVEITGLPLSMKGVVAGIYSRAIQPRISLTVKQTAGKLRLSGLILFYQTINANRG